MITTKSIPEINNLQWSEPIEIETRNGPMLLKKATPNDEFWNLYRGYKDILKEAGFSVSKFKEVWSVNWWAKDGEFLYPDLPNVDEPCRELELLPLVNEDRLKPFQVLLTQQTIAGMLVHNATLNGCGTGVGKTYITLAAARERERRLLVICPKAITPDWVRAAHFMGVTLAGVYGWEWIKTGKTPYGQWEMIPMKVSGGKTRMVKGDFLWTMPDDCDLVFDEIHRAAARDTQNGHIVVQAVNQGVKTGKFGVFGLSATIANDPTKMRSVGYMLGLHKDGRDFYDWMFRHGVKEIEFMVGRRKIKTYKFYGSARHLQSIHAAIFPHKGCRVRADQLGDAFPTTQILAKAYELDEAWEISAAYDEMIERVNEIMHQKEMKSSQKQTCILTEILRARQRVELLKVPLFVSLTGDYIEEGNSVVIAVNFRDTLKELVDQLNIKSVIMGGQKEHDRRNMIDDFQDNKVNIIAGIIQAMREGLNLHDVHGGHPRVALIGPTPSSFDLKQVLGRVPRVGGTPSIQRILFAAGTIEEQVCHSLADKLDQLDLIMDGHLQDGIFPPAYSKMRPTNEE